MLDMNVFGSSLLPPQLPVDTRRYNKERYKMIVILLVDTFCVNSLKFLNNFVFRLSVLLVGASIVLLSRP